MTAQTMKSRTSQPSLPRALSVFARFLFGFTATVLIAGFLVFLITVKTAAPPKNLPKVDGIVVLTGAGGGRLEAGAALLRENRGERLLISGVNPSNDAETVRALLNLESESFACCVDLDYEAANTVDNAQQAASWAKILGYEKIILVTSSYHMPRAKLEISSAMPNVKIIPYPVKSKVLKDAPWWGGVENTKRLFREFGKLLISLFRDPGRRGDEEG